MKRNCIYYSITSVAMIAVVGCGGGGSAITESLGDGAPVDAGSMRAFGAVKQNLNSTLSGGATVYALTGNITKATYNDLNPTLEETEIVYSRTGPDGNEIVAFSAGNRSAVRSLCKTVGDASKLTVSPKGDFVYFVDGTTLKRVSLNGGSPTQLVTGIHSFTISPDGTSLTVQKADKSMWTYKADGTSPVSIVAAQLLLEGIGQPSSSRAYFYNGSTIFGLNLVDKVFLAGSTHSEPIKAADFSPDGQHFYVQAGMKWFKHSPSFGGGSPYSQLAAGVARDAKDVAISPLDAYVAAVDASSAQSESVYLSDIARTGADVATENFANTSIAWTPFIKTRTFVGSGTYASAGMLMFSEKGPVLPGAVWADATTRNSITLTKISEDNASNTVYRLDCDQLTKLHFTRSTNLALETIVSSASGLKGALISFDSNSGKITTVATFTRQPNVRRVGDRYVADAVDFQHIFTGDGKRAAQRTGEFRL